MTAHSRPAGLGRAELPGIGVPVAGGLKATLLGALMLCSTVELRHADLPERRFSRRSVIRKTGAVPA